jgi:hypothetical protein
MFRIVSRFAASVSRIYRLKLNRSTRVQAAALAPCDHTRSASQMCDVPSTKNATGRGLQPWEASRAARGRGPMGGVLGRRAVVSDRDTGDSTAWIATHNALYCVCWPMVSPQVKSTIDPWIALPSRVDWNCKGPPQLGMRAGASGRDDRASASGACT